MQRHNRVVVLGLWTLVLVVSFSSCKLPEEPVSSRSGQMEFNLQRNSYDSREVEWEILLYP
jgi:hypothetical protein